MYIFKVGVASSGQKRQQVVRHVTTRCMHRDNIPSGAWHLRYTELGVLARMLLSNVH